MLHIFLTCEQRKKVLLHKNVIPSKNISDYGYMNIQMSLHARASAHYIARDWNSLYTTYNSNYILDLIRYKWKVMSLDHLWHRGKSHNVYHMVCMALLCLNLVRLILYFFSSKKIWITFPCNLKRIWWSSCNTSENVCIVMCMCIRTVLMEYLTTCTMERAKWRRMSIVQDSLTENYSKNVNLLQI